MDFKMQMIQASFSTQEQAESAVRKLASLRGDRFRLENIGGNDAQAGSSGDPSVSDQDYTFLNWSGEMDTAPAPSPSAGSFTLSANVPVAAAEQARSVIEGAGGQVL